MTTSPFNRVRSVAARIARLFCLSAVAFFGFGLPPISANAAADLDWRAARNVPYEIREGIEIARNRVGKPLASLSLICTSEGTTHLLLLTRLPGEDGFRRSMPGRDDDVAIFVGEGISNRMPIVVDVVALSDSDAAEDADRVETIITLALSREAVTTLADWFGPGPPSKVSVAGIDETGVFMVGTRDGRAIRDFADACVPLR